MPLLWPLSMNLLVIEIGFPWMGIKLYYLWAFKESKYKTQSGWIDHIGCSQDKTACKYTVTRFGNIFSSSMLLGFGGSGVFCLVGFFCFFVLVCCWWLLVSFDLGFFCLFWFWFCLVFYWKILFNQHKVRQVYFLKKLISTKNISVKLKYSGLALSKCKVSFFLTLKLLPM